MKKFSVVAILIAILTLGIVAFAAAENTEDVQFIEANGRPIGIFLNSADKKSACDGKTTMLSKDIHKGTIKGTERFHAEPYAVINWASKTVVNAEVLYRANDTELDSLFEGSILCLRGLNADRSRNDDIGEADFLFMAYLDKEGRKIDTVDYVFSVGKNVFSITHIRVSEDKVNYYLVVGDARKGDPKPKKPSKPSKPSTTDTTTEPDPQFSPIEDPHFEDPEDPEEPVQQTEEEPDPQFSEVVDPPFDSTESTTQSAPVETVQEPASESQPDPSFSEVSDSFFD
jgi:hypothetical protein